MSKEVFTVINESIYKDDSNYCIIMNTISNYSIKNEKLHEQLYNTLIHFNKIKKGQIVVSFSFNKLNNEIKCFVTFHKDTKIKEINKLELEEICKYSINYFNYSTESKEPVTIILFENNGFKAYEVERYVLNKNKPEMLKSLTFSSIEQFFTSNNFNNN